MERNNVWRPMGQNARTNISIKNGNISHYEFHVDSCKYFQNFSNGKYLFGGTHMTGFKTPKPVIIFGQDECIFQQYTLHGKQWVGPNGEWALLPKSDGYGLMVSAFQSREFGFGLDITKEHMVSVNRHSNGKISLQGCRKFCTFKI